MQTWASASSWDSWGIPKVLPLDVIIGNRVDDHHLKDRNLGKRNCLTQKGHIQGLLRPTQKLVQGDSGTEGLSPGRVVWGLV